MPFRQTCSTPGQSRSGQRVIHCLLLGTAAIGLLVSGCSRKPPFSNGKVTPPPASEVSSSPKVALANHLNQVDAKLFGTYWCPYCERQKEMFGEAMNYIPTVECDPKGANAQPELCDQANISSYPTWEINGKLYRGLRSLQELAVISGYSGSTNFGN